MTQNSCLIQLRRKYCWLLLAHTVVTAPVPAVHLEGRTDAGINFRGDLKLVEEDYLHIITDGSRSLGIPIDTIVSLHPSSELVTVQLAAELLQYKGILHLWQTSVLSRMVEYAEAAAEGGDWTTSYQAASRIVEFSRNPRIRENASELRVWSLFQLGLFEQSAAILENTTCSHDPLTTTARMCRILASLAAQQGDFEKAFKWAPLPKLRISADNSPFATELEQAGRDWLQEIK